MELINLHAFQVLKLLNNNEINSVDYVTELLKHINKREPLIVLDFKKFVSIIKESNMKTNLGDLI